MPRGRVVDEGFEKASPGNLPVVDAGTCINALSWRSGYSREWRYHMEEKVWITQAPGCGVIEKTSTYERGTYYFFDAQNWRKVVKEFYLDYSKLENQPTLPAQSAIYHVV